MSLKNPYLQEAHAVLPRLLALFDVDPISPTYGLGDRTYWAWRTKDFCNATFQGLANGLARLVHHNLLPPFLPHESALRRIDACFQGISFIIERDASLGEAYPREHSYCVTALVAYDLLSAIELLKEDFSEEQRNDYFEIVRPLIAFVERSTESHAVIVNHLATAFAALCKWHQLREEPMGTSAQMLLEKILRQQDAEGWMTEYGGVDPGYQTLTLYYLVDAYLNSECEELLSSIALSVQFLSHFMHPDGSFGGAYGSRGTRFCVPLAFEWHAQFSEVSGALASFLRQSIVRGTSIALNVIDEPNIIPFFNAYCWAAAIMKSDNETPKELLPCFSPRSFRKSFNSAGIVVDRGDNHYTIVSCHKGGVVYHFKDGGSSNIFNYGSCWKGDGNAIFSSQACLQRRSFELEGDILKLRLGLAPYRKELTTPLKLILLRIASLTAMRWAPLRELIKKFISRLYFMGSAGESYQVERTITLGEELSVHDCLVNCDNQLTNLGNVNHVYPHMASQGYWQISDDLP